MFRAGLGLADNCFLDEAPPVSTVVKVFFAVPGEDNEVGPAIEAIRYYSNHLFDCSGAIPFDIANSCNMLQMWGLGSHMAGFFNCCCMQMTWFFLLIVLVSCKHYWTLSRCFARVLVWP